MAEILAQGRLKPWRLLPLLLLAAGCTTTDGATNKSEPPPAPGVPCQIVTTWHNAVAFTPDPTHNGNPTPGLVGRLYLFGPEIGFPMTGDGWLVVDLSDETNGPPTPLEQWRLDGETLKKLLKRDRIGWGYTLFLPWSRYSPDITKVRLKVRYQPPNGAPLFTENAVTLGEDNGVVRQNTSTIGPSQPALPPQVVPGQPLPGQVPGRVVPGMMVPGATPGQAPLPQPTGQVVPGQPMPTQVFTGPAPGQRAPMQGQMAPGQPMQPSVSSR